MLLTFLDGGRYHIETRANQTGFYMIITASVMKGLRQFCLGNNLPTHIRENADFL